MTQDRMPLLFVGHGSPMNAVEDNAFTRTWQELGERLPRPRAILCISAHFITSGLHAVCLNQPQTIHDFYGFPQKLFDIEYPAPGSPELAQRVVDLLGDQAQLTQDWGLGHGAWSVLRVMYPTADIPVVQLSLDLSTPAKQQMDIGNLLAPLRDEGILILGSGNIVHNLREIRMGQVEPLPFARSFAKAVQSQVLHGNYEGLLHYRDFDGSAPSVNSSEHFVPLLNVLGAANENDTAEEFNHDFVWGSLSMTGYLLSDT